MAIDRTQQPQLATTPDGVAPDTEELLESLLQINRDAALRFASSSERLNDRDRAHLFRRLAAERSRFAAEISDVRARSTDGTPGGTVAAKLHRTWIGVKDGLTEGDHVILEAAEAGERYAVQAYGEALKGDLLPHVDAVVRRQYTRVEAAHDELREMLDQTRN
jgi:uncharacterized protein (TIGR02284 family)